MEGTPTSGGECGALATTVAPAPGVRSSAAPWACPPGEPYRDEPELGCAPRPQSALGWLLTARGRWARSGQVQPDDDVAVVALAGRMRLHPAEEPHRLPAPRGPCSR